MSSHLVFNGFAGSTGKELEDYWVKKKLPRLNKLLVHYPPDLRDIWLTVYRHQHGPLSSWYEARAVLHLPTGSLAAEAEDKSPEAALDQVADELVAKIKKHNARVRKDYVYKRKGRRRADLAAFGPLLQEDVEKGRQEAFTELLRPLLRHQLRDHALHELRILELDGILHPGEVTVDDLLDEVLTRAWERFADRPKHMPLELWLTNLLHESLEKLRKQEPRPHVSLEEKADEARPDEVPPMEAKQEKEEKEWWDELPPFEQTLKLEDLVPDREATEPWEELEQREQRDRLLSLLGELPAPHRQAFLLHALEDYDTAEIAKLQSRPEDEVKADIDAARRTLRDRLAAAGFVDGERKPEGGELAAATGGAARGGSGLTPGRRPGGPF